MLKRAVGAVLLTAAVTSLSSCRQSEQEARHYIEQSEQQWAESVATSDSSVVQRILADDVVWVFDGRVLNKHQAVAEAARGPGPFVSNHPDKITVRFFGDATAIAQGSETWTKHVGASPRTGRFVWTDTWIKRNGTWQIVAAEDLVVSGDATDKL